MNLLWENRMHSEITTLKNGLRIITSTNKEIETVSLGVWVKTGAAYEEADVNGISHFLEHTVFKGTTRRTALQITEEIENAGGQSNAYTSREFTAFYAKMLKNDAELAVDVLTDILQNPTFPMEEIVKERDVVIQEIKQTIDTPDDIIFDYFQEYAFPDQPIGRPILGSEANVCRFDPEMLRRYLKNNYAAENMVMCAVGNIEHADFVKMVESRMSGLQSRTHSLNVPQIYQGGCFKENRCIEQAHMALGFQGYRYETEDYYPSIIFSTLFGGGMSSRLFQEVREKRGLVYTVYSYTTSHTKSGLFGIYAGTGPDDLCKLMPVVVDEIKKVCQDKVLPSELARAKTQLKASMLMSLESSSATAEILARQQLIFDRFISVDEMVERIEKVTTDDIQRVARQIFGSNPTYTLMGAIDKHMDYDELQKLLRCA